MSAADQSGKVASGCYAGLSVKVVQAARESGVSPWAMKLVFDAIDFGAITRRRRGAKGAVSVGVQTFFAALSVAAISRYGGMAEEVLRRWGMLTAEGVADIVEAGVRGELITYGPGESRESFASYDATIHEQLAQGWVTRLLAISRQAGEGWSSPTPSP